MTTYHASITPFPRLSYGWALVLGGLLVFCALQGKAQQQDTVYQLDAVTVQGKNEIPAVQSIAPVQSMDAERLEAMPAVQVSDVLKLFSGVVIKDYGGVGGMKTVSVRGFGSQHTAVCYDGIVVSDCQTGQIDLSKFSLQNTGNVELVTGSDNSIFLPARAAASASTITLNTKVPPHLLNRPIQRSELPVNVDFRFTGGSFGLINPSIIIENRILPRAKERYPYIASSFNINYLQSKGDYPFILYYGNQGDSTSVERRSNSDVHIFNVEENLFVDFNAQSQMKVKIYYYQSERGLPGAVIFYKQGNSQRLYDQNAFGQVHFEHRFNRPWAYQLNAKFNFALQRYIDTNYLNEAGYLHNLYIQREYYLSNVVLYQPHKIISLSLANDLIYGNMNANLHEFVTPSRFQSLTVLAAKVTVRHINAHARLLHTGVVNRVKIGEASGNLSRFSPSAGISYQPLLNEELHLRLFYQNIFRLPTFNDLYYTEVGNRNLRPEDTHQLDAGVTYSKSFHWGLLEATTSADGDYRHTFSLFFTADGYYNRVKDKIVAIPSKNLFVWTMLNFGKVEMAGMDVNAHFCYEYGDSKWFKGVSLSGSHSLQYAVDRTDPTGKTYGHQIPYTPLHSGSVAASVQMQYVEVGYTLVAAGKRYTLQQNVPTNELQPYTDHSLSLTARWPMEVNRCVGRVGRRYIIELGLKAELLNLADRHYEIIRNYPMQGRSFRLTGWVKF